MTTAGGYNNTTDALILEAAKRGYTDVLTDMAGDDIHNLLPHIKGMAEPVQRWASKIRSTLYSPHRFSTGIVIERAINMGSWYDIGRDIPANMLIEAISDPNSRLSQMFAGSTLPERVKCMYMCNSDYAHILLGILKHNDLVEFLMRDVYTIDMLTDAVIAYGNLDYIKEIVLSTNEIDLGEVGKICNIEVIEYIISLFGPAATSSTHLTVYDILAGAVFEGWLTIINQLLKKIPISSLEEMCTRISSLYYDNPANEHNAIIGFKYLLKHGLVWLMDTLPIYILKKMGCTLSPDVEYLLQLPEVQRILNKSGGRRYTTLGVDKLLIHVVSGVSADRISIHGTIDVPKTVEFIRHYGINSDIFIRYMLNEMRLTDVIVYMTVLNNTASDRVVAWYLYRKCMAMTYSENYDSYTLLDSTKIIHGGNVLTTRILAQAAASGFIKCNGYLGRYQNQYRLRSRLWEYDPRIWIGPNTHHALSLIRQLTPSLTGHYILSPATAINTRLKRWMRSHLWWDTKPNKRAIRAALV